MGAEDVRRQALNVFRMRMLGATVGARTTSMIYPLSDTCP
jgi:tryptophan synthase beta subunit